jgi:ribosomal protein L29
MAAIDDLKQRSEDQLQQQLLDLKREQFNLRFQSATNQLEKPSRVREECPSASSPAPWCPTRLTRPWWSASSGG